MLQIACGYAYSACISQQGAVYMWGAGANGRLGLGDSENRLIPTEIRSPLLKTEKAIGNMLV